MNDEGFESSVRQHQHRVHSHAVWILHDAEEARDVTQEAMVSLWQHRSEVPEPAARSWLLRTSYRLCLDRLRRRAVRAAAAEDAMAAPQADPAPDPERLAVSAALGAQLERALLRLLPRDRAVVVLREVEGFSYDEIARLLDIPLGTVKAILHRSRERLCETLSREGVRP